MSDLVKAPVTNIAESLGGRIAGVQVSSSDGGLGDNFNIVIRGAGSLTGSTAPLYVVDGFPQETSTMSALNQNDIESIDILKMHLQLLSMAHAVQMVLLLLPPKKVAQVNLQSLIMVA